MSVQASATMPEERLVTDLIAAWDTHDLDLAAAFYAANYVGSDVAQPQQGREGVRRMLARYFQALPDVRFTLEELIVEDDRAAVIWTARGTHLGTLMNIPARSAGRPTSGTWPACCGRSACCRSCEMSKK